MRLSNDKSARHVLPIFLCVLASIGASNCSKPIHTEEELELLSKRNIPLELDILTIAKETAAEKMGVPIDGLSVENITLVGEADGRESHSRWRVLVERKSQELGGHCQITISDEGKVLEYIPGA